MFDVVIIGAGAVGCFLARELTKYKINVLVLEKENDVGNGASCANSAIIHSGYDPIPNSLKAVLNVKGNTMFDELSNDLDFEFKRIGSLTLAFNEEEIKILKQLEKRSINNHVLTRILSKEETILLEPNINKNVLGSLFAPSAGIVDPFNMVAHTIENAIDNGATLKLNEEVVDIENKDNYLIIRTKNNEYLGKVVINCAGLFSYKIANRFDSDFKYRVVPRKGEYYLLDNDFSLVNHVCFNVPSKLGKGVLITKTTSNNFLVGPNNIATSSEDDVSTDSISLNDIKDKALKNFPNIPFNKTLRVFAGNRAHLDEYDDFHIDFSKKSNRFINLVGIESPGLTASPAIAKYVVENLVSKVLILEKNNNFNPKIKKYTKLKEMSVKERNELILKNNDYGKIICSCEKISLGEIKELFTRSVPITSIKAIKKRLRTGYGRCQGGFCQPTLLGLLAEKNNLSLDEVLYDSNESYILKGKAK